jgi:hypothetical protein
MAKNIFQVINENINTVNENVLDMMKKVTSMEQEIIALSLMFKAPEKPTIPGEDGAVTESRESI